MPIEFYILCLLAIAFFGGWIARIDYVQYKADQKREDEARERRQANKLHEEYTKQNNRNNLFNSWVAESNKD